MLLHTQYKHTSMDDIPTFHYDSFWTIIDIKSPEFLEYVKIVFCYITSRYGGMLDTIVSNLILKNEHKYNDCGDFITEIIIKKYPISHLSILDKEINNTLKNLNEKSVFEHVFKGGIEKKINLDKKFDIYRNKNIIDGGEIKNEKVDKKIIYTKSICTFPNSINMDYFYTILDINKENNDYIKIVLLGSVPDYEELIQTRKAMYNVGDHKKIYGKLYDISDLNMIKEIYNNDVFKLQSHICKIKFPGLTFGLNKSTIYNKIRNVEI